MNRNYGKLDDGRLIYAPDSVRITERHREEYETYEDYDENGNGIGDPVKCVSEWTTERVALHPTAEDYLAAGYKRITDHRLPPSEGYDIVADGWDEQAEELVAVYRYAPVAALEPTVRKWTPLTLKRGAVARGWWGRFKEILQSADGYEDFLMCQYVAEDDPMFSPIYAALCNQFGADAVDTYLNELPTED